MKRLPRYRIRWYRVTLSNGHRVKRCLAEKRVRLFWLIPIWWPVTQNCDYRETDGLALHDIREDIELNFPLPATTEIFR